jgi:lipopolysaccharide biosynthesis protein
MKRVAIFAHYDGQNQVKAHSVHLLRALREDCDDVVFVSTSALPEPELDKVRPLCSRVGLKDNAGYDFGMWQHGLGWLDLSVWDELVLANSSFFGPISPLRGVFERMTKDPCDFWGMTDSFEISWHLQSYFIAFKKKVLVSPALRQFFDAVLPYRDKDQVIRSYEIGMTKFMCEQGFRPAAFVPFASWATSTARASKLRNKRENPTCFHPLRLIEAGMPLVKCQLLRDNPARVKLAPIYRAMEASGYDLKLIELDRPPLATPPLLRRLGGARSTDRRPAETELPRHT